jgi:eukaryotic-like serine/threonine-protein kinase
MFTDRANVLGKYRLIAEIAHGGMGIVYLAMAQGPRGFHKLVVVKELKPELVEEPTFLAMFLDEARLAARLSHPNIVQTNEVGSDGDRYFMAMEYLDGRGLDHVRRRSKSAGFGLSSAMHIRIIADMLAGLDYSHRLTDFDGTPLHIVHRDVSPQNVFVTFNGHVKLLDFGIAKSVSSPHQTNAGVLKGKVSYMSPEQARGIKVDARADVFSAGVMLWEALTGRRMRAGKSDRETLSALFNADLPRASSVRPGIPHELDEICYRALARDRDERYQSAGHLQEDLERYLAIAAPTVTSRDVGECVSELFREDRVRTSALIEAHVAHARAGVAVRDVPIIDVGARSGTTPSDRPGTSRGFTGTDLVDPVDQPSDPSVDIAVASPSKPRLIGAGRAPYRRPLLVTAIAGVATLAVVGALTLVPRGDAPASNARIEPAPQTAVPAPRPVEAAAAGVAEPASVTTPRSDLVSVEIRVTPATARLEIDDAELTSNPFIGRYRIDNVAHHVRASAPGYVTKTVAITFDANVKLDLSLERVARTPPSNPVRSGSRSTQPTRSPSAPAETPRAAETETEPVPAVKPPPAPSRTNTPSEISPSGGNRPQRPIDPTNPYGGSAP